ncbi:MlaD family protein [[Mycobacterium] burgundiense]|uniref:Mammalian cell entry protein n=1 Tax=[Mycobacterium] burgundiense TaxID=3064286 RepID=A0ABM9LKG5_9MYCO|nr:MlaD family protein [Mycolicibacterium sp. MU0053]CAJ1500519.1 mammalian cell entry protein [Mycolicibacterium sp. MU0053]
MLVGTAFVCCVVLAVVLVAVNPFGGRQHDRISVAIETPYVGQGVKPGSAVVMHGVEVGEVTAVASLPGGGVRLDTALQKQPVTGVTDAMAVDFRPINYFGVPGVNITPAPDGEPLRDGSQISLVPKGNFTLSQLLSQLGAVSEAALTPQLIQVVDRATRYTDGLNPLFETLLITTTAVANVQTVSTAHLLTNTASSMAALPPVVRAFIDGGARHADFDYYPERNSAPAPETSGPRTAPPFVADVSVKDFADESEDYVHNVMTKYLDIASEGLFAAVGKLESSHVDDLLPMIDGLKSVTDTVPPLLRPDDVAHTLAEMRSRFETLYAGTGEQRALRVRILLDSLPGVAAPLGVMPPPPAASTLPGVAEKGPEQ